MRQRAAAAASKAAAALARSAALALASSLVVPLWAARRRASALQAQLDALLRVGGTCEAPASPSLPREQGRATVPAASLSPPGSPGPATAHAVASLTLLLLIAIPFLVAAALRRASAAAHAVLHAGGKRPGHSLAALASYRLGAWVASSPASRPLILMALTAYFGGVGCLALFALTPVAARVGGEAGGGGAGGGRALSLTDTAWITVAGLGLDWRFVHDGLGGAAGGVGTLQRLVGLLVSVAGMLCTAFLVGLMTDSLTRALDSLRQGHGSTVLETGHSLVLGWSDKLVPMLTELAAANESEGGGVVVVLAERDKLSMDADVARSLPARLLRGTRVVCRSGSPMLVDDLEGVSAHAAKTVIVLADEGPEAAGGGGGVSAETKDASTLRVVLSLAHLSAHGGLAGPVVAEVCLLLRKRGGGGRGGSACGWLERSPPPHIPAGVLPGQRAAHQPGGCLAHGPGAAHSGLARRHWPPHAAVRPPAGAGRRVRGPPRLRRLRDLPPRVAAALGRPLRRAAAHAARRDPNRPCAPRRHCAAAPGGASGPGAGAGWRGGGRGGEGTCGAAL